VAEVPVEQLAGATELVCRLRSQVCDQDLCMPPSTERLTTPLPPVPAPVEPPTEGSAQPR